MYPPLQHPYMERTCTPHSKILLFTCMLQIWEINPKGLGTLIPYLPHKGWAYVHGILISSTPLYKHRASFSQRYMKFFSSHTFRENCRFFYDWFKLRRVIGQDHLGAFCRFITFLVLQVPSTIARVDNQLTSDFVHHQFPSYGKCSKLYWPKN